jgi:hypothetical protein
VPILQKHKEYNSTTSLPKQRELLYLMNGKLQYTHYANLNMAECHEFPLLSQAAKTRKRKLFLFAVTIIRAVWLNIVYHLECFQTHDPE